ncbi:chaplin family protein [Streptomyces lavendulocolor]|uniref:chaplin family protein n=1 Tax=Streptomyces lavendulocolor TaxID=67316 RepID=UPI003C30922D
MALATPASAGGIGPIGSPAFGNECFNRSTDALARGSTSYATGLVGGNVLGVPLSTPRNQCGGADFPLIQIVG